MKKSILELKGVQILTKEDQKRVNGAGACCSYGWCEFLGLPECHLE